LRQKKRVRITSVYFLKSALNLNRLWDVKHTFIAVYSQPAKLVASCSICPTVNVKKQCMLSPTANLDNSFKLNAL
jgi:hypothetical protein